MSAVAKANRAWRRARWWIAAVTVFAGVVWGIVACSHAQVRHDRRVVGDVNRACGGPPAKVEHLGGWFSPSPRRWEVTCRDGTVRLVRP